METDQLASVDNVLASRSLPPAIRTSIETLLEEYAQMERLKASWLLQEATLKAKIEAMEREKIIESKARASLAARVGMLEYALKENRCPDPGGDSSMVPVKLIANSDVKYEHSIPEPPSPLRTRYSDKYKTLPSNFLSRNPVNSGTKMLWKYLEELGYKPLTAEAAHSTENEQGNQPTVVPEVPLESVDASKAPQSSKSSSRIEKDEPSAGFLNHDTTDGKLSNETDDGYEETTPVLGQLVPRAQTVPSMEAAVDQGYSFEWICSSSFGTQWKPKLTMLHHLDAVRSVQFHDSMPVLFTGSEDGTAKVWNIDDSRGNRRLQPVHTYRGHSCMISSVTIQGNLCVSGSVDGKIMVWNLPNIENEDMYDAQLSANKFRKMLLSSHTNAVWDLHIMASELLYSCGADGFVHVWDVSRSDSHPAPKYSFQRKDENGAIVPGQSCSSVSTLACDPNKILVSYTSGHLEILDASTGQLIRSMKQIPRIVRAVSHPIHPLVLCASVDNTVLFCDVNAGTYVHRMLAHAQPVTSIAVSGDGSFMMSACHDSSIRFWDLTKRCCCQDLSAHQTHRRKYGEAIHSVAYHPSLDLAASGGADCAVKIYQN